MGSATCHSTCSVPGLLGAIPNTGIAETAIPLGKAHPRENSSGVQTEGISLRMHIAAYFSRIAALSHASLSPSLRVFWASVWRWAHHSTDTTTVFYWVTLS